MTRQLVVIGLAILVTALGLLLVWQFRQVAVYVAFSLALAAAARPLVKRLRGRGLARRLGLILIYALTLGGFGLLFVLSMSAAAGEMQRLGAQLATQDTWQQPAWLVGTTFEQLLGEWVPAPSAIFAALTGDEGQLVLPVLLGITQNLIGLVSATLVILFLSVYWSIDQVHFERLWLSLLPAGRRAQVRDVWRMIEPEIGAYIRNEAAQSLLGGTLLGLGYWALGSPYPVLLALTSALALLVPIVGSVLVVVLALVVGLLTSVSLGIVSALYAAGILIALKLWVEPRVFHREHYNPILTLVILLALADAFGFIGIIVAPPLSAACQILWSRLVSWRGAAASAGGISGLNERQATLRSKVASMADPPPLVTSSLDRLNRLLAEAEPVVEV